MYYTFILTYLLTPWITVRLEKLIGSQLVKKFPAFYGIRRFTAAFTSARHLSLSILSQFEPVLALTSHFLKNHLNIILPSAPDSSKWSHTAICLLRIHLSHQSEMAKGRIVGIRSVSPTSIFAFTFASRPALNCPQHLTQYFGLLIHVKAVGA